MLRLRTSLLFTCRREKVGKMRRGGGGLYGNFVSANDGVNNKAYRGAEIPPPPSLLQPASRPVMPKVGGKMVGVTSAALGTQAYFFRNFCSLFDWVMRKKQL